ncbi:MAG: glycerol kinase GlpK [Propionibacteriaceae bacterium]
MAEYVAAIDQGTTSTRCMIFDHDGRPVARHQLEHEQIMPRAGWVEHDPDEIWERTQTVAKKALRRSRADRSDLAALGLTNQRETTVVWNPKNGKPCYNAIVWQDTRTDRIAAELDASHGELIRERSGLPPATYFAGGKLKWILDHVDGVRAAADKGEAIFGTIDSWLLWNLTGGVDGGVHLTDVTNASRTMLMNLETLAWDEDLLDVFGVPAPMLPEIRPSSDPQLFGTTRARGCWKGAVPIAGVLGDQHAAMVGQVCFDVGDVKNTYGTGNFLLLNTGTELVRSDHGLLSTVCYQFGDADPVYALEGSIAVTGSAVQWLRDQLHLIGGAAESEALARTVDDNGGVYFVPAFSGLFAPYWRSDARGAIVGLSRFNTDAHLVRATLESICYQSRDVVEAMLADLQRADQPETQQTRFDGLKVDGGIVANELCMQIQADVLGVDVVAPQVPETTALGAAYAAGLAVGFWSDPDELRANWHEDRRWSPQLDERSRRRGYTGWQKAVQRTLNWVDVDDDDTPDPPADNSGEGD